MATKTITAYGNAQVDTAQSVFGGASLLLDGTTDYLSAPDSADWYYASGDFTIDFRIRFNALPGAGLLVGAYEQAIVDGSNEVAIFFKNNGGTYQVLIYMATGGVAKVASYFNTNPNLAVNTWYHFAWTHVGATGVNYAFQDGVQIGTVTEATAFPDVADPLYIGADRAGARAINGWFDEYRVSKGSARWTSNFTPPTTYYTADAYTVLLLHMDGYDGSVIFKDASAYGITGLSRDLAGAALGTCIVKMFKTADRTYQTETISDASGNYTLPAPDNSTAHFLYSFKSGSPDVFGGTDDDLVGA